MIWAYEWPNNSTTRGPAVIDADALSFVVRLGDGGYISAAVEAKLSAALAAGDASATALVRAYAGSDNLKRVADVLTQLYV